MQASPPRLLAQALACRRGERVLFAGLGLELGPGEALHVRGANGIGKSSLLRLLAGLARPEAGQVIRQGAIGLVDERPALDPHLPLGRALGFWAALDGGKSIAAAARLGLGELLDVPVRYLSSGQRKRAALARLITQPAMIWLLDEPLNGLDAAAADLAARLAAERCATGGICVIASHQPFALAGMATLDLAGFAP
ncbi:MAG: heme ABC exporter ATP-binding protein CcmA [Sphingomonadales bacterium]|nr:heme ABC exporter ATP-binding protein CcmA [Sphingomonadales bacterium]